MKAKYVKAHKNEMDREIAKVKRVYFGVVIMLAASMVVGQALLVSYGVL